MDAENRANNQQNILPGKKRNKCFLIMVTVIVVLFASLFASLFILYKYIYPKHAVSKSVICESDDCVRMAAVFKKIVDPSVDPCDNFVEYACGKWPQSYLKPDAYVGYSWFEYIHRRQTMRLRDLLRTNLTDVYGAQLPRAVLEAQKLYNSCIDTDTIDKMGLQPVVNLLKEFNLTKSPPALMDQNNSSDLVRQAAVVKRSLYKDVFFKVEVYVDLRNVTKNLIVIGSPSLDQTFRHRFNRYDPDKVKKFLKIVPDDSSEFFNETVANDGGILFMKNVIREMMNNYTDDNESCREVSSDEEEKIDDLVENIIAVLGYIHQFDESDNDTSPFDDEFEYDELPEEELMSVDNLQKLTNEYVKEYNSTLEPQEIWKPFIEELFQGVLKPNWHKTHKLWVYDLKHLQRIAIMFAIADKNILETITWWTVLQTITPFATKNLRDHWNDYMIQLFDLENTHSRSFECVSTVNDLMGIATSWLYFDKSFNEEDKPNIQDMVNYMKTAFTNLVITSNWIDHETKLAILRKNSQPLSAIGYPDWLFVDGKVDEFYTSNLQLSETDFLSNIIHIVKSKIQAELQSVNSVNNMYQPYWVEPIIINAFHAYERNQIIIPASILEFPFYTSSLKFLNYGLLGAGVIGHELAHGFDDLGRRFNEFGNLKQWWSNETIEEYVSKTKCYIDHYDEYYIAEVDSYVNGKATLNENLADVLGLKQAFLGYQQWKERHEEEPKLPGFTNFTHEQLFFLSYATSWCQTHSPIVRLLEMSDSHAPSDVRVLGALRNSKEFSNAWHCPVGSYMNPEKKCTLW